MNGRVSNNSHPLLKTGQNGELIIKSIDNITLAKSKCIWKNYRNSKTMKKKLLLPEDIKLYMIMIATFCYLQRQNSKVFKFRSQLFL